MPSAQFFVWRVLINKVPTRDNINNRGVRLGSNTCALCAITNETVSHLFFTCKVTTRIWQLCDSWIGRSFVYHNSAGIYFSQFELIGLGNKHNNVWRCMWLAIVWDIWNHRNKVIFRNAKVEAEEVFMLAQTKVWAWITNKYSMATFSYSDCCLCPITGLLIL